VLDLTGRSAADTLNSPINCPKTDKLARPFQMIDKPVADAPPLTLVSRGKKSPKKVGCPICKAEAVKPHFPFCSRQCAQVDLGHWLMGDYAIPAHEGADDSDLDALLAQADKDPTLS
jgi:uncharacterized protein